MVDYPSPAHTMQVVVGIYMAAACCFKGTAYYILPNLPKSGGDASAASAPSATIGGL